MREAGTYYFYGGPLSNFARSPLELIQPWTGERVTYLTVEHRFQAMKATNSADHERIRLAATAKQTKRLGRQVGIRADWEAVKYQIMLEALTAKFSQNPASREALITTGDQPIAEDSPYDAVWGIRDRHGNYTGDNLLGKALMTVRAQL